MARVHVAVGSNISPHENVPEGLRRLHDRSPITTASPFYRTPAIGRPDQDDYLNGVVVLETDASPRELRATLDEVESLQGRVRTPDRYAPRTLDLDPLLWGGAPFDDAAKKEILERPFLMRCLLDLDPLATVDGIPLNTILPPSASFRSVRVPLPF